MHRSFKLTKDITGADYDRFLRAAAKRFPWFMLVWRDQFTFKPSARAVRRHLRPFEVRRRRSSRWPGNIMYGHKGDVLFYPFNLETLQVLQRPGSLLSWMQPYFPEDLAFFGADRKCALASVTHERDIWILDRAFARRFQSRLDFLKTTSTTKIGRSSSTMFSNHRAALDAATTLLLHSEYRWRLTSERGRSAR